MKKILFSKTGFLVICIAANSIVYSQTHNDVIASVDVPKKYKVNPNVEAPATAPNANAVSTLNSMFNDATEVIWGTYGKNLPIAYFKTVGKANRARFDKKGKLVAMFSYYQEEQLPTSVLLKVKQAYYSKNIFAVTEVNYDRKTAYLIILEDKTSWLHIKIVGDEMEEEKVLLKPKN